MPKHNAGKLKQTNKKHKGGSKRSQRDNFGPGKVASRAGKKSTQNLSQERRHNRLNRQKQLQQTKRAAVWLNKRIGSNVGPPKVIGIIPLSQSANVHSLVLDLIQEGSWSSYNESNPSRLNYVNYPKHKSKVALLEADFSIDSAVEIANMCDILLLVTSASLSSGYDDIVDQIGKSIISVLRAVGLPQCVACVQGLKGYDENGLNSSERKTLIDVHRITQQYFESEIHSDIKLYDHYCPSTLFPFHSTIQSPNYSNDDLIRGLVGTTPREISWRSLRSYLLVDSLNILPKDETSKISEDQCSIKVTGYLRGCPLYLHSLAQIKGVGTGRIVNVTIHEYGPAEKAEKIEKYKGRNNKILNDDAFFNKYEIFNSSPSRQDPLILEAAPDILMGEQTWPSEEEMNQGGNTADGRNRRDVPSNIIPSGMSTYQADWLIDDEGKAIDENENDEDDHEDGEGSGSENNESEDDMEQQNNGTVEIKDLSAMLPPTGLPKAYINGTDSHSIIDDGDDDITLDGSILTVNMPTKKELQEKRSKDAEENERFPDEVDTPEDVSARVRFARYRALQSFRSSPWHPKENLPIDYSRIFQFESFYSTQRSTIARCEYIHNLQDRVLQENMSSRSRSSTRSRLNSSSIADSDMTNDMLLENSSHNNNNNNDIDDNVTIATGTSSCLPGTNGDYLSTGHYVTIEITNLSSNLLQQKLSEIGNHGFLSLFSLLQHEYKLSVLHFTVQRNGDKDRIIKSKDQLIFETPFRQFEGKTIFSELNLNCDKHKMERFFQNDSITVASVYGPVTYMPCPILIYQTNEDNTRTLVGSGALSSVDPDRIILKKIILTGFPIRVKKRNAVVRHLFYDPQDVRWFKPAELTTKYGHRGYIREPVGTHGLFKASFSAPIKQNDTVMLVLYKRVYPKFPINTSFIGYK